MRFKCLACEALARVAYLCAAHSPHIVDVELFRIGLHREPGDLRATLQARVDAAQGEGYDAVVMVYGLCGQSTAGLEARDLRPSASGGKTTCRKAACCGSSRTAPTSLHRS